MNISPPIAACLLLLGAALSPRADAQDFLAKTPDPNEPLPAAPLLRQDGAIGYSIVSAAEDKPAAAAPGMPDRLDEVDVEKAGNIRHEVTWWNGRSRRAEAWCVGSERFDASSAALGGAPGIRPHPAGGDVAKSFPELDWVAPAYYVGGIREAQNVILVFRKAFRQPERIDFGPFHFDSVDVTVYIGGADRLPLAVKSSSGGVMTYRYGTAPDRLELPADYQAAYQGYLVALKSVPLPP